MRKNKLFIFFGFFLIFFNNTLESSQKREYQLSNQHIINGNFEGGNAGFQTDYLFSPTNMRPEGTYCLSQNPRRNYSRFDSCFDRSNQSGYMFLINGFDIPDKIVWKQTVRGLEKNSVYLFSFWGAAVNPVNPSFFEIYINNRLMLPSPAYLPESICNWSEFRYIWNSLDVDTAEIKIYNRNLRKSGNDCVLDDISFTLYCSLSTTAQKNIYTCKGIEARLNVAPVGGEPPFRYEWFPKIGLDNPYSPNPTVKTDSDMTYIVRVIDNKLCEAYDTVKVHIYPTPIPTITSSKGFLLCPCDSTKLTAPAGMTYKWSTGETSQSIFVNKTGTVSLNIIDKNGCSADTTIFIEVMNVSSQIAINNLDVNIGETFNLPIVVKSSDNRLLCGFNNFNLGLRYDRSILQPSGQFINKKIEGNYESVEIAGNNIDFLLNNLKFTSVLGRVKCSPIEITHFKYDCDSIKISSSNGQVCLKNLCEEGGTRLVDTDKRLFISLKNDGYPSNEIDIEFGIIESGFSSLQIYDNLGRLVKNTEINDLPAGIYVQKIQTRDFNPGLYFVILVTPSNIISSPVMITR